MIAAEIKEMNTVSDAERIESSGRVERVRMVKKNSIRELSVDGVFRAHYHDGDHALAAEALAKLSLS